ncbi:MAG: hypothetical protein ACJ8EL_12360, partial [Rhizomicrobium sp.]
ARRFELSTGGTGVVPMGVAHTFRVDSETARVLVLSTPAGIEQMIGILAGQMSGSKKEARSEAIAILSVMLGALVLARATGHTPRLSDEILSAGRYAALKNERTGRCAANRIRRRKNSAPTL